MWSRIAALASLFSAESAADSLQPLSDSLQITALGLDLALGGKDEVSPYSNSSLKPVHAWPPTACDVECFAAGLTGYFSCAGLCMKKYENDLMKMMSCIVMWLPSMPVISVIAVARRTPSAPRES